MPTAMPGSAIKTTRTNEALRIARTGQPQRFAVRPGSRSAAVRSKPRTRVQSSATPASAETAVLQERARIARDLHDSVAQTLYAIGLSASRALRLVNTDEADEVQHLIHELLGLANAGQSELRALMTDMRSDRLTSGGLIAGLAHLAGEVRAGSGLDICLSVGDEPDVPAPQKEALVLIAREALHNVVKHAAAHRVDIVLDVCGDSAVLLIADDGRGFDPTQHRPGHFGLHSMRERAAAVGGTLELDSAPESGTRIHVHVPRTEGRKP